MSPANICPDRSCLQALLAGELAQKEQEETVRHVETCAACQQTLDSLTPASQSWENLVPHLVKKHPEPAPALRKVIAQAKVGTAMDHTDAEDKSTPHREAAPNEETQADPRPGPRDDDLAFLSPPTKAGSIGRLAHYEILAVIGKGGFGTVLKAFDEKLHRMVAIKVLSPELSASGTARQRFIREARAAAAVTHENLVTIHAVEEDHRPPYLVMQLIDGVTLQQKIDKAGTLGLKEILRIGLQMAAGLAAAHKQGLVHRDIKPTNVLLENGVERVKITDFGLARAVDDASVTQSGTVAGTPMYMSPEQAEGLPLDHRSDLFSLGTVLYVMCTGRPPFRATGTMAVLKRVTEDTPRPIRETNPEIPDWLASIITKLHAKKPEERFQTAKEVAELLGQHLADLQQGRAESVSDRSAAPATAASTPVADAPGSPSHAPSSFGAASLWFAIGGLVLPICLVVLISAFINRNDAGLALALCGILFAIGELVALAFGIAGRRSARGKVGLSLSIISLLLFSLTLWWAVSVPQMASPVVDNETMTVEQAPPDETGWFQLFNGKDLTGWKTHPNQPGNWRVEEGVLVGSGPQLASHLFSERGDYENFHLQAKAKINFSGKNKGAYYGNSGIYFRAKFAVGTGLSYPTGYEAQISTGDATPLFKGKENRTGSLYGLKPYEQIIPGADAGEWFTMDILARGNRITIKINGNTTVDEFQDNSFQRGHFVLQQVGAVTSVYFKKIEIKELPIEVRRFKGHEGDTVVACSPDGAVLYTASAMPTSDGTIRVHDINGDKPPQEWKGHTKGVTCLTLSADGSQLASCGTDESVRIWDTRTGTSKILADGLGGWVWSASFSPDGKTLAVGLAGQNGGDALIGPNLKVYDLATGKVREWSTPGVRSVAISPTNGNALAVACGWAGQINAKIISLDSGLGVDLPAHGDGTKALAFVPHGQRFITGGFDGLVAIWDLAGTRIDVLKGHTMPMDSVACSSDGKLLLTTADRADEPKGKTEYFLWDLETRKLIFQTTQPGGCYNAVFIPRTRTILTGTRTGEAVLWRLPESMP